VVIWERRRGLYILTYCLHYAITLDKLGRPWYASREKGEGNTETGSATIP
jgi:hypothetical protein